MCTIMFEPETLPAEKRSRKDSQQAVDRLMEYDRALSEPFTREELKELFTPRESFSGTRSIKGCYELLTEAEKVVVEELGLTRELAGTDSRTDTVPPSWGSMEDLLWRMKADPTDNVPPSQGSVEDRRRQMKAGLIRTPAFDGGFGFLSRGARTGRIYVWLDSMCFGNSDKTGFYYVRWYNSMLDCDGMGCVSTAYGHPALIVQKSKLRPDQVEYMDRKCRETRECKDRVISWAPRPAE
ncbi:MAG: hypothetical protein IJS14_10950 [Lentisphaeria bacterium]|nr:hypothetical protein [Lentisphaeria bacterium]